jgi:HlyD family secretion protein
MRKPPSFKVYIIIAVVIGAAWAASTAYFKASPTALKLSGEVQAREIRTASRFGGRVKKVWIKEGQVVKAGQPLIDFDDSDLQAKLADARATLSQSIARERLLARGADLGTVRQAGAAVRQSQEQLNMVREGARPEELSQVKIKVQAAEDQYHQAKEVADNGKTMLEAGIISRQKYDTLTDAVKTARANADAQRAGLTIARTGGRPEERRIAQSRLSAAQAQYSQVLKGAPPEEMSIASSNVEKARSALQALEAQVSEIHIKAPFEGYISVVGVTEGELIAAGRPVVSIIDYSHLWTDVYVPESNLIDLGLAPGEAVRVYTNASRKHEFPGRIALINPKSEFVPNSGGDASTEESAFRVKVDLNETQADGKQLLYPGMKVNVRFRP